MAGFNLIACLALAAFFPAALAMPWGPWGPPKPTWTYPETTPTWTYPATLPTGFPTVGPTATATGTGTGSGYAYPTGHWANKRDADVIATEKREAFQGARKRDWPHHWPCSGDSTSYGYPTGTGTGTGYYPTGTGYTGWMRR